MTPAALLDDLAFLRKFHFFHLRNWRDDPPLEEVRRGSAMLRRWLADKELVGIWREAGFEGEPRIAAIDLAAVVASRGGGRPEFALAGAAAFNRAWRRRRHPRGSGCTRWRSTWNRPVSTCAARR